MKRFFCILLTMILLGSLLIIPVSAVEDENQFQYGHYISPGEYVLDDVLDFSVFTEGSYLYEFDFEGVVSDGSRMVLDGFRFFISSESVLAYYVSSFPQGGGVYYSSGWVLQESRYITILNGFYIYDSLFYQWWQSNVIRVSSGYDSNLFDGFFSAFIIIGQLISGAVNNLTSMFWVNGSLTFYGILCISALSLSVIFLLIGFISIFLRFRG